MTHTTIARVNNLQMMIGWRTYPRHVGEALSLPKLTQLGGSLNVERLRRSGRLRAAPTRCGGNRGLAGRQVGDPYVAHSIDNVFTHLQLMQSY